MFDRKTHVYVRLTLFQEKYPQYDYIGWGDIALAFPLLRNEISLAIYSELSASFTPPWNACATIEDWVEKVLDNRYASL